MNRTTKLDEEEEDDDEEVLEIQKKKKQLVQVWNRTTKLNEEDEEEEVLEIQKKKKQVVQVWRAERALERETLNAVMNQREEKERSMLRKEERKGRMERIERNLRREELRKERKSERATNLCEPRKEERSLLEIVARQKRDHDLAKRRYELARKDARERKERDERVRSAAEKFKPKVFRSSNVLRAQTALSRERFRELDAYERAKIRAEQWFLPTKSVV